MVLPIVAQQSNPINMLMPFIILAALIYFFGIRPVSAQKKKQEQLHSSLSVGDEVVTIGAWKGTITEVEEDGYWVRLSEDTTAFILKAGIARKVIKESDLVDEGWTDEDEAELTGAPTQAAEQPEGAEIAVSGLDDPTDQPKE